MFCMSCGAQIADDATFCGHCGAKTAKAAQTPPPAYAPPPPPPPAYAPPPQYAQPAYAPPPPPKRKRHGCLTAFLAFLLVVVVAVGGALAWINGWFIPPRYSTSDFKSAMDKIGLSITFDGMSGDELAAFIKDHRGEKFAIADYDFEFSDYVEKTFTLTEREANAVCNLIAPNFSWFDKVDFRINEDGSVRGSYVVDFAKVKEELIPDLLGDIPAEVDRYLPNRFTLTTEGKGTVVENRISMPDGFTTFNIGPIPMKPIIEQVNGGPIDDSQREEIFDIVSRIYRYIPDLVFHSIGLRNGEIEISAYFPTRIVVTSR